MLDQSLPLDQTLLAAHPDALRVANRSDLQQLWDASAIGALKTVAVEGRGLNGLRAAIRQRFGWENATDARAIWWTKRQETALRSKIEDLNPKQRIKDE